MKKLIILLSALAILFVVFGYKFYSGAIRFALDPLHSERVMVDVKKGSTATEVAETLYQKGLIKSPLIFRYYITSKGLDEKIKSGRMVLMSNYTLPQIADALVSGKSVEMPATILEGWTIRQIGEYLQGLGLTTVESFVDCSKTCDLKNDILPGGYTEGYLYPDTYFVDVESYSDRTFISRLINTLNNKLTDEDWDNIKKSGRKFADIMIMASIVEREEGNSEERPTVAGILWNRLDANQGLGADATILYALGRTKGGLTAQDLEIDSQYNTRKYRGLPPTPICNPSISAIRAAISPAKTDYWYYLHDSEGNVHYARTLDEHNINKAKYIR